MKSAYRCMCAAIALLSTSGTQAQANRFFKPENMLGCGTVVSVREVKQAPLYDAEYERHVSGRAGTADLAVVAVGFGLLSAATAGVASLVVDALRDGSVSQEGVKAPPDGEWKNIKAVRIVMDEGAVINLPLMAQPSSALGTKYEAGKRVGVYWLPDRQSIQVALRSPVPDPGAKNYQLRCKREISGERASEIFQVANQLVNESLVVN
ncbi:hypothetical protein [Limnohabitans sp.]|uniref:hypothetical protein n=1 Tax=Limnohabitans sp. TaxID=1907725 RepID=UPI00391A8CD2